MDELTIEIVRMMLQFRRTDRKVMQWIIQRDNALTILERTEELMQMVNGNATERQKKDLQDKIIKYQNQYSDFDGQITDRLYVISMQEIKNNQRRAYCRKYNAEHPK